MDKALKKYIKDLSGAGFQNSHDFGKNAYILTRKYLGLPADDLVTALNENGVETEVVKTSVTFDSKKDHVSEVSVYGIIKDDKAAVHNFSLKITKSPLFISYKETGLHNDSISFNANGKDLDLGSIVRVSSLLNKFDTPTTRFESCLQQEADKLKSLVSQIKPDKYAASRQVERIVTFLENNGQNTKKATHYVFNLLKNTNLARNSTSFLFEQDDNSWRIGCTKKETVFIDKVKYIKTYPVVYLEGPAFKNLEHYEKRQLHLTAEERLTMAVSVCCSVENCENYPDDGKLRFDIYCPELRLDYNKIEKDVLSEIKEIAPDFDLRDVPVVLAYDYDLNRYSLELDAREVPGNLIEAFNQTKDFVPYPFSVSEKEMAYVIEECDEYVRSEELGTSVKDYAEKLVEQEQEKEFERDE